MASNKKEYKKQLISILKDAERQVQINYGKTIQPIAKEYSEFLKTLEVNAACDENCVVDTCFTPENLVMNWTCVVRDCQCYVNVPQVKKEAKELKQVTEKTAKSVAQWASQNYLTKINDAYRTYRMKQVAVISKIGSDVRNEIISQVPESENCFNFCDRYYSNDLTSYVPCLGNCAENYEYFERYGYFDNNQY